MTQSRKSRRRVDANFRTPENLTSGFQLGIAFSAGTGPKADYLRNEFLTKFVSKDTAPPLTRKTAAIRKWLATERENEATNARLMITDGEFNILPRVTFDSFVEKACEVISAIVGEIPAEDDLIGGFSGGASTSKRRTESHPAQKFLGKAHVTAEARPLWESVYPTLEAWHAFDGLQIEEVVGNVMFTVPKNTDIDRCACKEPDLNMFMQKGLGTRIRRGLRRVGIDLNDQSRNRQLAYQGSVDGSLATLDLSSASDSVSTGLVQLLLPIHWFVTLDALRCKVTLIDGIEHRNEMFSSMGNGFTFELESLLFYALARTTAYFRGCPGVISVYGDDIIAPTELAQDLMWVLGYFGFSVNPDKSFWSGSFRESCGGHFVSGRDITPFYLRAPIDRLTDLIRTANKLREWSEIDGSGINDPEVWPLWSALRDRIPRSLWGGREYSSITQLVSPDRPKLALKPESKRHQTGDGGYVHWLYATHRRVDKIDFAAYLRHERALKMIDPEREDQVEHPDILDLAMSERTEQLPTYRLVKARRAVLPLEKLFVEEL